MSEIKPWKTLETTTVYENARFKINNEICQLPDGVILQNYFVEESRDWVIIFCVNKAGEVVLVKQYRQGSKEITLELTGGFIERHDINPTEAARRELMEETGYASDIMEEIATWTINPAATANKAHIFFAPDAEKVASPKYLMGEVTEAHTVLPADLLIMINKGEIASIPQVAAIYKGLARLGAINA
jgi:ADP-ribose pyrophosphatase